MKLGLNIGCGNNKRQSTDEMRWINIDVTTESRPDRLMRAEDVGPGQFRDIDEIIAEDILEHIPYRETHKHWWNDVLSLWCLCLRPGGTIRIQVPSLVNIYNALDAGAIDEDTALRVIYGERTTRFDRHYQLFTNRRLEAALIECGLEIVESFDLHVNIVVVARKP